MYSLLVPLDPNVQRHNAGASVPPGGTWRSAARLLHRDSARHHTSPMTSPNTSLPPS